jgi:ribosomal-protein-alanine N-acetyltransferase
LNNKLLESKIISNPGELFQSLPSLETERLHLRRISTRDANDIFEYASDPEVAKFVTWEHHRSIADSIHYVRMIVNSYSRGEPSPWGIILKEEQKLIGTGGFHWWLYEHSRAEVGYTISARYWNRGLMTEALKAIIEFGFEKMMLNRIEAKCYVQNAPSEKVLQKCGMKFEGILRESLYVKEEFRDLKMYSIIKSEYEK